MNKRSLFFCFLFVVAASVAAQTNLNISYGVKAGVNFSTITSGDSELPINPEYITGFHIGGLVNVGIHERFSIQPELLYSTQGYFYDYGNDIISEGIRTNWHYLNLPIMGQYAFTNRLFVEVGPQFGYVVSDKHKFVSGDSDIPGGDMMNFTPRQQEIPIAGGGASEEANGFNRFDVSLVAGAGYLVTPALSVNARYAHGLMDTNKNDYIEMKNRVFSVGVSYIFR